jgi:hypothetical protein
MGLQRSKLQIPCNSCLPSLNKNGSKRTTKLEIHQTEIMNVSWFNNALSTENITEPPITWWLWIWIDKTGSDRGQYYGVPSTCLGELRKTMRNLCQNSHLWAEVWRWDLRNMKECSSVTRTGSPVTTAWHVIRMDMDETVSGCEG